jgi:hypothetical protein
MANLNNNNYEDNNSQTYHKLTNQTNFIDEVDKNKDKLKSDQTTAPI